MFFKRLMMFAGGLTLLAGWLSWQGAYTPALANEWQAKVAPELLTAVQANTAEVEFLVELTEQADVSAAADLATKEEKGQYVFEQLTKVAEQTQKPILELLSAQGAETRPYWVMNVIWVKGNSQLVAQLAQRSDVAYLYANPKIQFLPPESPIQQMEDVLNHMPIEWGVQKINAPSVWSAGFNGTGVVVAGQDTGYDWDHPALINKYRGWNGTVADHNYNWHDAIHSGNGGVCGLNSTQPCDDDGHGTHTMGTMVGDDGGANQIGVAPGAKWIGCRNMDVGNGTPTTYIECFQFFLAPTDLSGNNPLPAMAPHVINNSWGCPVSEGCNTGNFAVMEAVVNNLRAAGIMIVASAGNSGSSCSTVSSPAAIFDAVYTVGATNSTDTIASFSSRGPVTVDGSGRMKPDISAPGVNVRSSTPGGGYVSLQGTSMAGPHVAGAVALLISAEPSLAGDIDMLEDLMNGSAFPRTTTQGCGGDGPTQIPNNVFGHGRLDVFAAYQAIPSAELEIEKTAEAAIDVDTPLNYTLTITNTGVETATNVVLTDVVPMHTTFLTGTMPFVLDDGVVMWSWASLPAGESATVNFVVQADVEETSVIVNDDYGVSSEETGFVAGEPVETMVYVHAFELLKTGPAMVEEGEPITYTLTFTHEHGTNNTTGIVLTDTLPAGTTFITATGPYTLEGNIGVWAWDTMAPNEVKTVLFVVMPTEAGMVMNEEYGVKSDDIAAVSGPAVHTTVAGHTHDLEIALSGPVTATIGEIITYTFTLTNAGHMTQTNVVLTDVLPVGTTFITTTQPYTMSDGLVMWMWDEMPEGSVTVELVVQVARAGTIVNSHYGVESDDVHFITGPAVSTEVMGYNIFLPVVMRN